MVLGDRRTHLCRPQPANHVASIHPETVGTAIQRYAGDVPRLLPAAGWQRSPCSNLERPAHRPDPAPAGGSIKQSVHLM